jgi:hypothetical protein
LPPVPPTSNNTLADKLMLGEKTMGICLANSANVATTGLIHTGGADHDGTRGPSPPSAAWSKLAEGAVKSINTFTVGKAPSTSSVTRTPCRVFTQGGPGRLNQGRQRDDPDSLAANRQWPGPFAPRPRSPRSLMAHVSRPDVCVGDSPSRNPAGLSPTFPSWVSPGANGGATVGRTQVQPPHGRFDRDGAGFHKHRFRQRIQFVMHPPGFHPIAPQRCRDQATKHLWEPDWPQRK